LADVVLLHYPVLSRKHAKAPGDTVRGWRPAAWLNRLRRASNVWVQSLRHARKSIVAAAIFRINTRKASEIYTVHVQWIVRSFSVTVLIGPCGLEPGRSEVIYSTLNPLTPTGVGWRDLLRAVHSPDVASVVITAM